MEYRRGGGSQTTIPRRKRKKGPTRKEAARIHVVKRIGEEAIKRIQDDWASWDTSYGGKEWQLSAGVVLHLLQQGFSEGEIRAIVPVGGSRIARLTKVLTTGVEALHTRRDRPKPWHAFSEQDLQAFKLHCSTWVLEDVFPCAHRRQHQYFTEPGLTWLEVHARYEYEIKRLNPDVRTMSYSRFTQYVHYYFPGVRLTRTAEDVCDCCVRLDIQLQGPNVSDEQKQTLLLEKRIHIDEAIAQRRFVSPFIKDYGSLHAPAQMLPHEIIPDTFDAATTANDDDVAEGDEVERGAAPVSCRVQIQAEDFGGGISMPFYGHSRPSADYFNSNLILHNFVVADITNNRNNVFLYDERAQGKDANALCSLRLLYHLTTIQKDAANGTPVVEISFSLLDNCVGQNKSKVVLMFFAMLSVIFPYKKVVLCFLLPGHSHNIADRVVGWCRNAKRGSNIYTPSQLVDVINKVKSVNGIFLDHNERMHPFYIEWGTILGKYVSPPPAGYTSNYLFEIDEGVCTARTNVDTPDKDDITFQMIDQYDS